MNMDIISEFLKTGHKPRILVVDDQPMNILVINDLFKTECEMIMATSGAEAIALAGEQQPDLILLDIVMPEMDGYSVCEQLKAQTTTQNIPVIFVTAESEANVEAKGFEVGAVDFITKPFNPLIVRARVNTHLTIKLQMDRLMAAAMIDGLTGLANRRRFDEASRSIWSLCQRQKKPLTLLMLDIDFFKRYNDTYGHIQGDECLKSVAQAIKNALLRATDISCRYGGEEFACLLPFTDDEGAAHCAQNVISAVRHLKIPHAHSRTAPYVTVSIGAVTTIPNANYSFEQLKEQADITLYKSKSSGRNAITTQRMA